MLDREALLALAERHGVRGIECAKDAIALPPGSYRTASRTAAHEHFAIAAALRNRAEEADHG